MYTASKKTRMINAFQRTAVIKPRDIYARYGMRLNPKAVHGTDAKTPGDVLPLGSSVIESMVRGQEMVKRHTSESQTK